MLPKTRFSATFLLQTAWVYLQHFDITAVLAFGGHMQTQIWRPVTTANHGYRNWPQATKFGEIMQKNCHYSVQDHSTYY